MTAADVGRIARDLNRAAAVADMRGFPFAGIMRQAVRLLLETNDGASMIAPDCCAGCGEPLNQPATGRRRKWCREACRSRARRR